MAQSPEVANTSYTVTPDYVYIARGWLWRRSTVIATAQILNVEIVQGPLLRAFDAVSVRFTCISEVEGLGPLERDAAERIRATVLRAQTEPPRVNASTAGAARRLPLSYLPAAYLESSPKLAGSLTAGGVYLFGPDVWPGAWAWLALGPLIAVLVIEPVWRWTFTRVQLTPTHLNFTTGGIHRREQSLAWTDIAAVDSRQSWAFARWRLFSITLSQAGDERAKVQLWAADEDLLRAVTASAGHALDRVEDAPTEETEPTGTLLYRVRLGQLLLASVVFGQFAVIGGAAAMAVSEMLQTIGADDLIARWFPLPPAVWGASILGGVVALGLVLTVIRYASFECGACPTDACSSPTVCSPPTRAASRRARRSVSSSSTTSSRRSSVACGCRC